MVKKITSNEASKKGFKNSLGERKRELEFLLKFFIIYGVLQLIIYYAPLGFITEAIASFEASLLGLKSEGNIIRSGPIVFAINNSCSGFVSISVLAAIVFSFKKPGLKQKFLVFLCCAMLLFLVNLLRVYIVLFAGVHINYNLAEPMHIASWFLMSGAIILLWYEGTKRLAKVKNMGEML